MTDGKVTWMIQNFSWFHFDLGDCRQITFVTLSRFCKLSNPPLSPTQLFLTGIIKMDGIPTKSMKNTHPLAFYIVFKFWRLLLIKILGYSHWIFYFFCFMLAFTSADIVFHQFLELHSTLSGKKIFVINFPFLTDSFKPLSLL